MRRVDPCYDDLDHLGLVTNLLFRHRNRLLRWVIRKYLPGTNPPVDTNRRVREMGIHDIVKIADYLREMNIDIAHTGHRR
jgi:16S rRNA (adenine1518-N6/adenine1519-N6)-dimethyltransferase